MKTTLLNGQEYSFVKTINGYSTYRFYLYNNFGSTVTTGEKTEYYDLQLEEGSTATQFSPYVSNPIELCKIGNYIDKLKRAEGKNLCSNIQLQDANNIRYYFDKTISQTFTFSTIVNVATANNSIYLVVDGTSYGRIGTISGTANTIISGTYTLSDENYQAIQNGNECYLLLYKSSAGFTLPSYGMLNEGTTALPYEPYGNVWYIEKNIGKVVLNGSESSWGISTSGGYNRFEVKITDIKMGASSTSRYIDYFMNDYFALSTSNAEGISFQYQNKLFFLTNNITTLADWKTWVSNNNITVYYALATPTYETITNENLIQQLNNIQDIELIENLCYVDWVGEEKPTMKLFCYLDKDKIIEEITD